MLEIAAGAVRAYYLFDVADTIDVDTIAALGGDMRAASGLPLAAQTSPAYLQFPEPPLVVPFPDATIAGLRCSVRLKAYGYGVVSLRLTFDAAGTWGDLAALATAFAPTNGSPRLPNRRSCARATTTPAHSTIATRR